MFFPLIVVGGLMGVFAGYGVLAMVRDHGFNLKPRAESADGNAATQAAAAAPKTKISPSTINEPPEPRPHEDLIVSNPQTNQTAADATERMKISPPERRRRQATPASEASLKVAVNDAPPDPQLPPPADPTAPPLPPPTEPTHDGSTEPSAIVPLTLTEGVIRVIAIPENVPAESLLCDVGFSPELTDHTQMQTGTYDIVAEKLGKQAEYLQELPLHISGAGAAIEIKIRHQNKAVICEIRPKFSLPFSGIEQLTIARGSALQNSLTRSLNDALAARQALPNMHSNLTNLKMQLTTAQQNTSANGSNPADTGLIRHNATMAIPRLNRSIAAINKDIAHSEQLVANEPAFRTDLADLNEISQYAQTIASVARIYVRFYSGSITIPATIK